MSLESAAFRAAFFAGETIVASVLSGAFVVEITDPEGKLRWGKFYQSCSFWVLLVLALVLYKYHRAIYARDTDVSRFGDDDYCVAYMRAQCLPEAAKRAKERIRKGYGGQLESIMNEVKKTLK